MKTKNDFNVNVMREIGLDVDKQGNITDQDNGNKIQFKGKNIKYNNAGRDDVLFDPLNNPNMMGKLFSYFVEKINTEDPEKDIRAFYPSTQEKSEKGYIEVKEGNSTIRSGNHHNDSIKYAELIMTLNGSKVEDFSELDSEVVPKGR